jgi:ADP-ribose pyrophosphatase YjhB (NUDIX family)
MRDVTLCILVKKEYKSIIKVCLAMKKRGFGVGKWNGVGGKVDAASGETIEVAMIREAEEEIAVKPTRYYKVAEIEFTFPERADTDWDQLMHTYLAVAWTGDPTETEEMKPEWFKPKEIPFRELWPGDRLWMPKVFEGKSLKAAFAFTEDQKMLSNNIKIVEGF